VDAAIIGIAVPDGLVFVIVVRWGAHGHGGIFLDARLILYHF
jgi:hypothetical protein